MPINDQRIRKTNLGYLPTDGAYLNGYIKLLKDVKDTLRYGGENKLHQEKFYCHTNQRSSYCFVCDWLDMIDYIWEILEDIEQECKKHKIKFVCERPPDSHDPLTFRFVAKKIR